MPAKSKSQQRFMGMVHAVQKGELSPSDVSDKVKGAADQMDDSDAEDYASTKHDGKPEKVAKETLRKIRDAIRTELESCGYTHTVDGDKLKSPGGTGPEDREFKVDVDEGFGSEDTLDKKGIKEFEQWRKDNAEQLGYTLSGTPDVKEERDYKAEYKKFQSSDKAKKYRAELNQYNRKKGTYGNGDGKDASHKGGKIVGFETQSKNRGRAEKSRLKQERSSVGDVGLGFLIDQLINSMEHYDQREFIKHMKKELDLKPQDSKKLWKLYWKINPRKRMRMWPQEWERVLKRIGITESVSINESAVSFWQDMFRPGPIPKKYINQLIKKRGELPSKKHIKKIYRSNGNPSSSELAKTWKLLTKEKYVRAASGMWRWNKDFTGWESVNEARSTNREWNKFEKDYGDFFKTVVKLGKANTKLTGDKTDEKIFLTNFTRNVGKFYTLMKSWKRGQNESVNEAFPSEIPRTKIRLLKMNAKYLADDLMDMYKELNNKDVDAALVKQHLDTLKDKVKMMRKNVGLRESVNEEITLLTEGYTNYWKHTEDFTPREWSKIVRLAKTAIKKAERGGIVIRDGFGKGKPKIDNKQIYLNGDGENNLDHETFLLTKKKDSGLTKTNRKPYDAVVATILVGIEKIAPEKFNARADGRLKIGGVNNWKNESINERKLSSHQKKAILIAIEMSGNMTGATKKIEKIKRGLSNDKKVKNALRLANESVKEARTINVEPNWEGMWRFFKRMAKTNPRDWKKMERTLGSDWLKIDKMAQQKGWKSESVNEGNFDRGTSGLPKGFTDDYYKIVKKLSKGKGYLTLSKSDKKKVWATLGKIYTESVNEYDLGLTYKRGKTVKVKHKKSGKELVIIDKPNVKREYEKIGYFTESVNEDIGIDTYLGGIVKAMGKARLKPKTAKQMKHGFSKSKDKIGFFIKVEQRGFGTKEMYTLQLEVDRDGNLWYLSGHRPVKLGKWADTSKIVRGFKALNKIRGFGQSSLKKKESVTEGFNKYRLGGLLDSKLKKRLERTIKIIGGKVDGVGDDYIKFRISTMDLQRLPAVITKLDRNKNVWIGNKRNKNIWDRKRRIDKLEFVNKRCTVKEVSKWLKTLEEFRYRKVRSVDARRVASFVNRGMNEEDLPMTLRKKWEHRQYGREKHLAVKYLEIFTEKKSIKEMDLLEATSPVKIGSALPGSGGRRKEIEIVVDKSMGKWKIVYFNMVRKYVSGVGHSPDRMINYDDIFKLSSSEKNTIKKIIKNPEDIAYMDDGNVKPKEVLRALK